MPGPVIIFEDPQVENLYPLTLTRPVFDLRCGILTLAGKARAVLGDITGCHVRDYLAPSVEGAVTSYEDLLAGGGTALMINGRAIMSKDLARSFERGWRGAYVSGGRVVAASVGKDEAAALDSARGSTIDPGVFDGLPTREVQAVFVNYPWDLVNMNGSEIESDHRLLGRKGIGADIPQGAWLVDEASVYVCEGVSLSPGVVLDASGGPIHIARGATIMANSSLEGPLFVGEGSIIKMGSKIYGETSIGPVCKIGGEVAETIVHAYSNKQHEGFVGHSYLGEWTNLGAGTETSDLKNNYSTVRVRLRDKDIDTGEMFVGLFMGDHSKCGIGTTFNTGTAVGACCNIFGAGYPPRFIPSFTWGGSAGFEEYDPARAIETAGRAMRRRGVEPGPAMEAVLKRVYEITGGSREVFIRDA